MNVALFGIVILALFLEGTVTSLPLVLVGLLLWAIVKQDTSVFFAAFFTGIFLDLFAVRFVGSANIYLLLFVLLILLYQKKFEIASFPFVFAASFFGSLGYLFVFGYDIVILKAVISSIIAVILFSILNLKSKALHFK